VSPWVDSILGEQEFCGKVRISKKRKQKKHAFLKSERERKRSVHSIKGRGWVGGYPVIQGIKESSEYRECVFFQAGFSGAFQ